VNDAVCRIAHWAPLDLFERLVGVRSVRPWGRVLLVAFAAGYLAACTQVVDSVVESRYGQYNHSTDWAKNEAILLNIARASEFQPLNFLSFQPYTGSATVSASASSPSFIIGPDRIASQKQYTIGSGALAASATGTGTINVTSLDTSDFYDSLLSPVDFANLNAFQRQSYPRELLFRLFTDYVSLKPLNGDRSHAYILYNEAPERKRCVDLPYDVVHRLYGNTPDPRQTRICFEDLVGFALLSGLSSEVRTVAQPSSSPAAAAPAATAAGSKSTTPPKMQTEGRLCFDPALANREMGQALAADPSSNNRRFLYAISSAIYHPICGGTGPDDIWLPDSTSTKQAPAKNPQPAAPAAGAPDKPKPPAGIHTTVASTSAPGTKPSPGVENLSVVVKIKTGNPVWDIHLLGKDTVEIGTRSTFSIYSFLGRLLRQPQEPPNELIEPDEDGDKFILTVHKGQPTGCFAAAVLDLTVYCVPIDHAENTKRSFSILSQLLALKTTTDDLQLTPTLRLLPD
jgi:hypothetical protein